MVGRLGLEPRYPEGGEFTVHCNCHYATDPYGTPQGFEPIPLVLETNVLPIKLSVYVVVLLTLRRMPLVETGVRLRPYVGGQPQELQRNQTTNFSILV